MKKLLFSMMQKISIFHFFPYFFSKTCPPQYIGMFCKKKVLFTDCKKHFLIC